MSRHHVLFLFASLALVSPTAFSCSCIAESDDLATNVRNAFSGSVQVVYAEATKVDDSHSLRWNPIGFEPTQHVEWRILRSWKGHHRVGDFIESSTMIECCECGVSVEKGERHIFYLSSDQKFAVTQCSVGEIFRKSMEEQVHVLDELIRQH